MVMATTPWVQRSIRSRQNDRARDLAFCLDLIDRCTHGVVAIATDEGAPYCLPLSLVRVDRSLYFHGAKQGRKAELLRTHPRVSVTFVGRDCPAFLPPYEYTTFFQSVLAVGTVHPVTDPEEQAAALRALCRKLTPDAMDEAVFSRAVREDLKHTAVWRIDLEELSGKEKPGGSL